MLEHEYENLIALYPGEFFPNEIFILCGRQVAVEGRRIDIVFEDTFKRKILIEIKRGVLTREASGQIAEYYGLLKCKGISNIELILVANTIPAERRAFLETVGISCKEISDQKYIAVANKYNIPIDLKTTVTTEIKTITVNNNKELRNKTIEDLYNHIVVPHGKAMIDCIIDAFNSTTNYKCYVEQKQFYSCAIRRKLGENEIYDYAFIVNRKNLLFYIRKPGEKWLQSKNLYDKINNELKIMRNNKMNEITIRVDSVTMAEKICSLLLNI